MSSCMLSCTCFIVILFLVLNSVIHVIQYNVMAKSSGFKVRETWVKVLIWKGRTNGVMRILLKRNNGFVWKGYALRNAKEERVRP